MSDQKLRETLNALEVPDPDEKLMDQQLERARLAFAHSETTHQEEHPTGFRRWLYGTVVAGAFCLMLIPFIPPAPQNNSPSFITDSSKLSGEQKFMREMVQMFPGQLQAVVANGGSPKVVLGDKRSSGISQPLIIKLQKDGKMHRLYSFSGEHLDLKVGEIELTAEVYITGAGEVVIMGENFLWSSEKGGQLGDFSVTAKPLELDI